MKVTIQGKEYIKRSIVINNTTVDIDYISSDGELEKVSINFPLAQDDSYNPIDFNLFFLVKKDVLESDIYQVYDRSRDCRIGWIFPVVALDSTEHEYASNEHFVKYANVAKHKIFNDVVDGIFTPVTEIYGKDSFKFGDFFYDSTVILLVSKVTLDNNDFNILDWLPSLSIYGYSLLTKKNPDGLMAIGTKPTDTRVYIKKIAYELQQREFISIVYSDLVPYENHPLLLFFYCYQIIEIMLTLVFQVEQSNLFAELGPPVAAGDVVKTKDVMENIGKVNSEKYRIRQLTQKYLSYQIDSEELKEVCNEFLEAVKKDVGNTAADSIYRVRNFLFHQYHSTSGAAESDLRRVNVAFLKYLCDLCSAVSIK